MRIGVVVAASFALLATSFAHAAGWVIPAGREQAIKAFVEPLPLDGTTSTGHRFDSIAVDRDVLVLVFQEPGKSARHEIELRHPSEAREDELVGPVTVRPRGVVPAPLLALVRETFAAKSEPGPWVQPGSRRLAQESPPAEVDRAPTGLLVGFVLALFGALLAVTAVHLVRTARGRRRVGLPVLLLGAITAAGLVLRLRLSPRTFLHEFYHVGDYLHDALYAQGMAFLYGATGPALYRATHALVGGHEEAVFLANALLATLTVPAVALLDLALFRSWPRALLAGAIFAVLPIHLRFAASEELTIPSVLFATWGVAALAHWLGGGGRLALAAGVGALALAVNTRPEMALLPVLLAGLVLLSGRDAIRRFLTRETLVAIVVLAVLCLPRLIVQVGGRTTFEPNLSLGLRAIPTLTAFADPTITPATLWVLGALGLVWGAWTARGVTLWLLGAAAAYVLVSLSFFQNPPPYSWRTQLVCMPFLVVVCTGAVPLAASVLGRWRQAATAVVLVGAASMTAGLYARVDTILARFDQQAEFDFLREHVALLPDEGRLLTVAQPGGRSLDAFPYFLAERNGKRFELVDLDATRAAEAWPDTRGTLLFYQGMYCYFAFPDEPTPVPLAERCAEVHRRYVLEPLHVRTIHEPPYSRLVYHPGPYELGFHRVVGRKRRSPPPDGAAVSEQPQ